MFENLLPKGSKGNLISAEAFRRNTVIGLMVAIAYIVPISYFSHKISAIFWLAMSERGIGEQQSVTVFDRTVYSLEASTVVDDPKQLAGLGLATLMSVALVSLYGMVEYYRRRGFGSPLYNLRGGRSNTKLAQASRRSTSSQSGRSFDNSDRGLLALSLIHI